MYNVSLILENYLWPQNAIKDILKDVLKHTHGLGIFEMVKIFRDSEKTEVETVDADKTVIFKGETLNPAPDFVDYSRS